MEKIQIKKSPTADTRSCDFKAVSKETLYNSSVQHIGDIRKGFEYIKALCDQAAEVHDHDKLADIDGFHADFLTGFEQHSWWDNHRKVNRHHLLQEDGVPADVNLVDVLDFIIDCTMAGMARSGTVYKLNLDPQVLQRAFENTVALMTDAIEVVDAQAA